MTIRLLFYELDSVRMDKSDLLNSPNITDHERELREYDDSYRKLVKKFKKNAVYTREDLQDKFDISLMTTEDTLYVDHPHLLSSLSEILPPVVGFLVVLPVYFLVPELQELVPIWAPIIPMVFLGLDAYLEYLRWKYTVYILTTDKVVYKKIYLLEQKPDNTDFLERGSSVDEMQSSFVIRDFNLSNITFSNISDVEPNQPTLGWLLDKVGWGFSHVDLYGKGSDGVDRRLDFVKDGSDFAQLLNKRDSIQERLRNRSVDQDPGTKNPPEETAHNEQTQSEERANQTETSDNSETDQTNDKN